MVDIKDVVEEVKSRCDIVDIISQYMPVENSGTNYKGLCPFHGEKTPSFYINSQKQIYKCFGCGEGGDVINFVMKLENLEFMDAVKLLADKCGIEINNNIDEKTKAKIEKSKRLQEIHLEAARYYLYLLLKTKNNGYEYLRARGLDDKIIKNFGLGFAPKSWNNLLNLLTSKGYSIEDLLDSGLILQKKDKSGYYDRFINRVLFPIFDYKGNVIGFGGRVLDDSLPKYLNSPDTLIFNKKYNLYGLNFARKNITDRTLILVEGYMDLIAIFKSDIKNVVATLGTAFTKDQGQLIKRYADTVIISYDSDDAGIKAAIRAIDILTELDVNVKVLNLREAKDPDEFIIKYGVNEYKKSIDEALHYVKFKIDNIKKKYNLSVGEEKIKFIKECVKILKHIKSPVEIDYYTKYISEITDISIDSIKKEIYGRNYNSNTNREYKQKNKSYNQGYNKKEIEKPKAVEKGYETIEKTLIKLVIENTDFRNRVLLKIDEKDFILNDSKEIINYIIKNQDLDKISIDNLKGLSISENYLKSIDTLKLSEVNLDDVKAVEDIIKNIRKNKIQHDIDMLLKQQKELEKNRNNIDEKEVDVKIMEIALNIVDLRRKLQQI